jgi:peptidoglycan/LPS O-acetylase OafA/YrhL
MSGSGLRGGEATAAAPSPALAAPPGNPRFPLFDGLRGIAVLAVLLLHSSELSGRVGLGVGGRLGEAAGGLGVIVFFVISGFLLYRPFAAARATGRRGPPARRYARRRALRILPAYWIVLTILATFPAVAGAFTGHWWRYYGFLQAYFSGGSTSSGIPVAWTLCVEVTFYVALPLWAAVLARRAFTSQRSFASSELVPLVVLAVVGLMIQILAARHTLPTVVGSTLPGASLWFAIGMAIAVLSVLDHAAPSRPVAIAWLCDRPLVCWTVALAAVAGLMVMVPAGGIFGLIATAQQPQHASETLLRLVLEAVVTTGLILPAVFAGRRSGLPRRIMGSWPLVRLGVISYSFYLWHLTIVEFIAVNHTNAFSATGLNLMAHVHSARMTVLFLVSLVVAAPISAASYVLFERPFLRRKERKDAQLRPPSADDRTQHDTPMMSVS